MHSYDETSKTHTFNVDGTTILFNESTDEERHPSEQFRLVTFVPAEPSGEQQNIWFPDFDSQDLRAGLNAMQRTLYSPLNGNPYVQIYDPRDEEIRKFGRMGWIHFTQLDLSGSVTKLTYTRRIQQANRFVNRKFKAIINNPRIFNKQFQQWQTQTEMTSEWMQLIRKTEFTWTAQDDNTVEKRTNVGNGSLLASFRVMLHQGVTFRVAPTVGEWEIKEGDKQGEIVVLDKLQKNAQRFFTALMAVAKGEVTLEEAGRQFFQDALFQRISAQDGDVELEEEDEAVLQENAERYRNGEEPKPTSIMLYVEWESDPIEFTALPAGNYVAVVDGKNLYHENKSWNGRKRLTRDARTYQERLVLAKSA